MAEALGMQGSGTEQRIVSSITADSSGPQAGSPRFEALLRVSDAIANHRDLDSLIEVLAEQLRSVMTFDYLSVSLYDPADNCMKLRLLVAPPGPEPPAAFSVGNSPSGRVFETQRPMVISNLEEHPRDYEVLEYLYSRGVRSVGM
ncbi:MAG: GAF domain-containing protein, partial [Candidatus Korobacteraceae bacterium]